MESPATITVFSKISDTSNNLLLDAAGRFTSQKTLSLIKLAHIRIGTNFSQVSL